MLDNKMLRAIGMLAARRAREMAAAEGTTVNDVIDMTPLLAAWKPGPQTAGAVVVHGGYPYRTITAHDSTGNDGWTPEATPALFAPYHATDAAHALPYRAPTNAEDAYKAGEWMIWTDGKAYRCTMDATTYGPDVLPDNWEAMT